MAARCRETFKSGSDDNVKNNNYGSSLQRPDEGHNKCPSSEEPVTEAQNDSKYINSKMALNVTYATKPRTGQSKWRLD